MVLIKPSARQEERRGCREWFGRGGDGEGEGEVVCPLPADFPNPGIELGSPALQADSLPAELPVCNREWEAVI